MAKLEVHPMRFGNEQSSATIVVDKTGLHVDNKIPEYDNDDYFIKELLRQAIDTSAWSHSWHMDISKAKNRGSEDRKKLYSIINKRIASLEDTLSRLKQTKTVLGRWHY